MKKVFENPSELENLVKQKLSIPPFLMMENAALFLSDFIIKIIKKNEIVNDDSLLKVLENSNLSISFYHP